MRNIKLSIKRSDGTVKVMYVSGEQYQAVVQAISIIGGDISYWTD